MNLPRRSPGLDIVAMGVSAICAVHCLALPLAASLLPLAGAWAEAEWVHWAFFAIAAPVSALALGRAGVPALPRLLGATGVLLLLLGALELPSHSWSTLVTVTGAFLLAWAHIQNSLRGHKHARTAAQGG
jgi:hypothetical protein